MDIVFWVVYVLWAVVNGVIAHMQGRQPWPVLFGSVLLSPLLIWLYLVATPAPDNVIRQLRTIELLESIAKDLKNTP